MSKNIILVVLLSSGFTSVFSQNNREALKTDSLYIDSLIGKIPEAKDTVRINYLNKLSNAILRSSYPQKRRTDLAYPYLDIAYRESKNIHYKKGIAHALINWCSLYTHLFIHNTRAKIDNALVEKKYEEAVVELQNIATQINDPELLGDAYSAKAGFYLRTNNKEEQLKAQIAAINWYKKAPLNESRECENNLNVSYTYLDLGEFEKAFEYCSRSLTLAKKLVKASKNDANEISLQLSYTNMAQLYQIAGDYEMALSFLHESRHFHQTANSNVTWDMAGEIGELYLESGQFDSALYYLKPVINNRKFSYEWPQLAKAYYKLNEMDSALRYYNLSIDSMEKRGMVPAVITGLRRSYLGKAFISYDQNKYDEALNFSRKSLLMQQGRVNKLELVSTYELMSKVFYNLGKSDSAYLYLVKHNELKNSLLTRQFYWRINNYKQLLQDERKTSQINLLNKDNLLKDQQLKQEAQQKKFLLIGLAGLLITGIFFFRYLIQKRRNEKFRLENEFKLRQLESEKKQAELHQRAVELEMQALRAQMNPHFIFNCLSSINRFIFKNDNKTASDYLTRFSRLIRMVLLHSQKKFISLEDELEMIRLYLDLERLRFKNAFDYSITTNNIVDHGNVFIPPLLLQPFCENAVWHGLMHKEIKGYLNVTISEVVGENDRTLHCVIQDDGVGREKAAALKSKSAEHEKSLGLKITTERLALLNNERNLSTFYKIEDVKNENNEVSGTRVELKIRYKESMEELV